MGEGLDGGQWREEKIVVMQSEGGSKGRAFLSS